MYELNQVMWLTYLTLWLVESISVTKGWYRESFFPLNISLVEKFFE